jgi:hypothetical protein
MSGISTCYGLALEQIRWLKRDQEELIAALQAFVDRADMDFQETFKREIKQARTALAKAKE